MIRVNLNGSESHIFGCWFDQRHCCVFWSGITNEFGRLVGFSLFHQAKQRLILNYTNMKSTTNFTRLFVIILAFNFSSCSDNGLEPANGSLQSVATLNGSLQGGSTLNGAYTITPSGDLSGVADANNIQFALGNVNPGGTILLKNGVFYVNRTIVAPSGFAGTLKGAGKENTKIVCVGNNNVPFLNDQIHTSGNPYLIRGSSLFFFPDLTGSISVSDFSVTLPVGFATEDNDFGDNNLIAFITVNLAGDGASTRFDNLRLTGTAADPDGASWYFSQPAWGIQVLGDRNPTDFPIPSYHGGRHALTNTDISKVGIQATVYEVLKNATIEISGNSYSEIKQTIYMYLDACNLSITKNKMKTISWGAIVVTQQSFPMPGASNSVVISDNTINTSGYLPIEIGTTTNGANYKLLIEKNTLTNNGADPLGWFPNLAGIGIFNGNDGAVVRNNIIRGNTLFGILQESNGATFIGNNLEGINALYASYALFGNNNTVVGNSPATVYNFGQGNILTGLTKVEGISIGDLIKQSQAKRKEILDALYNE